MAPVGPQVSLLLLSLLLGFGEHCLPLIGSCDWNDGMNPVGEHDKGESVWLGFFLYEVLMSFTEVATTHGAFLSPSVA